VHKQIKKLVGAVIVPDADHLVSNLNVVEVRRNTVQFIGLMALLGVVVLVMQSMRVGKFDLSFAILAVGWAGVYVSAVSVVLWVKPTVVWCIRISLILVLVEGLVAILRVMIYQDQSPSGDTVIGVLIGLTLGALLFPWTPKQTLILSVLWIVSASTTLLITKHSSGFSDAATIFAYIAVTVPGLMISFFRMSRFEDQFELHFLQTKFDEVREELQAAKSIHERGFPKPKSSGDLRFTYIYRPMSQIGGDSIFASIEHPGDEHSPVTLVLYDVTGHGLSAALTANRLQGELMRIMGEDPTIDPGELLTKLDRYVCLTLADSAVLVSAVAISADPSQEMVRVANAGHPAPVLRESRGTTRCFESSSPVLGVSSTIENKPKIEEHPFLPGDSLIAYTDGVSEASIPHGELYNTEGVERVLNRDWIDQSQRWPEKILADVENRRAGSAKDDILIVELYRPQSV